jgi:hypothetical protein
MYIRKAPSYVWALCPTVVLFSLAVVYGSLKFYRDPGSVFYDPSRATERGYSVYREKEVYEFRNTVLSQRGVSERERVWKSGNDPTISAVFLTVHRPSYNGSSPIEVRWPFLRRRCPNLKLAVRYKRSSRRNTTRKGRRQLTRLFRQHGSLQTPLLELQPSRPR